MFKKGLIMGAVLALGLMASEANAQSGKYNYYYAHGGQNECAGCKNVMKDNCRYYSDALYIAGRVGVTRATQSKIMDGDTDNALTYGGAIGFNFPRSPVRIEAELMSYELEYGNDKTAQVYNGMGNVYVDLFFNCSRLTPFIFAGLGVTTIDGDDGKDDYFAYQAGAGFSYRFSRPVAIEFRYAYQSLAKSEDLDENPYRYNHAHQLTAGLRIYF